MGNIAPHAVKLSRHRGTLTAAGKKNLRYLDTYGATHIPGPNGYPLCNRDLPCSWYVAATWRDTDCRRCSRMMNGRHEAVSRILTTMRMFHGQHGLIRLPEYARKEA